MQTESLPPASLPAQSGEKREEVEREGEEDKDTEVQADFFLPSRKRKITRVRPFPYTTRSKKGERSKVSQETELKEIIQQRLQNIRAEVVPPKPPPTVKVSFGDDKNIAEVSLSKPPKRGRKKLIPKVPTVQYKGKKTRDEEKMQQLLQRRLQTLTANQPRGGVKGGVKRKRVTRDTTNLPPAKRRNKAPRGGVKAGVKRKRASRDSANVVPVKRRNKGRQSVATKRKWTGKDENILSPSKRNKKEEEDINFVIMT